jgi:hypothetical protein
MVSGIKFSTPHGLSTAFRLKFRTPSSIKFLQPHGFSIALRLNSHMPSGITFSTILGNSVAFWIIYSHLSRHFMPSSVASPWLLFRIIFCMPSSINYIQPYCQGFHIASMKNIVQPFGLSILSKFSITFYILFCPNYL